MKMSEIKAALAELQASLSQKDAATIQKIRDGLEKIAPSKQTSTRAERRAARKREAALAKFETIKREGIADCDTCLMSGMVPITVRDWRGKLEPNAEAPCYDCDGKGVQTMDDFKNTDAYKLIQLSDNDKVRLSLT